MKQFAIKQKMWSLGGRFMIVDEIGAPCYEVEGSLFKLSKSYTLYNNQGQAVSRLTRLLWHIMPHFKVVLATGHSFMVKKDFRLWRSHYTILGLDMEVQGNVWEMSFQLLKDGQLIAEISQEWLRLTSTYKVIVYDERYSDLVLSLVIAIDYVKEQKAKAY
ncbi:LURP-one-related/scramblase family protein [Streptococcus sp. zg-JUN1979]|uniref:LURP-one-related/scramblase family protein n=1 Tax=Streptococcus sp. zg-JUN1979 TaxID=3391450 RepID=UPI0039A6E686